MAVLAAVETPVIQEAAAPFNRHDADFVITTVDGVNFRVFRSILMLGSEHFEGMFTVPQPPRHGDNDVTESDDHTILPENGVLVTEDSETMDTFLRICYPHTAAQVEVATLTHLGKVLAAGQKYVSPPVVDRMRRSLVQSRFLDNEPLCVFAIACSLELEEEAQEAAKKAIMKGHVPMKEEAVCREMDAISAGAYHRLLRLNQARSSQRTGYQLDFDGIEPICRRPPLSQDAEATETSVLPPFTSADADVILRTSDSLDFHVHRNIIQVASPRMLDIIVRDIPQHATEEAVPVYNMRESSIIVDPLLRFCYPGKRPQLTCLTPTTFLHLLAALKKYGLNDPAEDIVEAHWPTFAGQEPFRFYFHAIALGLPEEARICARLVAESPSSKDKLSLYTSEMESTSCLPYRRLIDYIEKYRTAATQPLLLPALARPCTEDQCACRTRCPTSIITRTPPPELTSIFQKMRQMVDQQPCGRVLAGDISLVGAILDAMHSQRMDSPALAQPMSPSYAGAQWVHTHSSPTLQYHGQYQPVRGPPEFFCTMSSRLEWASNLLRNYAEAVDRAVSQVSR